MQLLCEKFPFKIFNFQRFFPGFVEIFSCYFKQLSLEKSREPIVIKKLHKIILNQFEAVVWTVWCFVKFFLVTTWSPRTSLVELWTGLISQRCKLKQYDQNSFPLKYWARVL